jgi:phosphomannomutase
MALMVSISGIRGTIGDSLTPETIIKYASAYAEYCKRGHIVVGRDGRITGKNVEDIVVSTLLQMGCEVTTLGICPTPTVALAVETLKAAGGISITASHNPMIWNGLKFFASTGLFLDADENRAFWKLADNSSRSYAAWDKQGRHNALESFIDDHNKTVLALPFLKIADIRKRHFKVVLDCVNAAGGAIVPKLLAEFGCEVIPLSCDISGIFSHTPEPIPENLTDLCQTVKTHKADLGIAVDPDVDRLVLINEKGEPYGEEYTIATCVDFVLKKLTSHQSNINNRPSHVVVNLSSTRAVEDIAQRYGATTTRTPVGEINVAKRMKELNAVVGGEGSGGIILPAVHLGRDAMVGIALVLEHLMEFGGTLSALKATLPQYLITKGKVALGTLNADAILKRLQEQYAASGTINTDDGLKIDFADSWVHLRKSNTEPIIRIIAEAHTKPEADALVQKFTKEILS